MLIRVLDARTGHRYTTTKAAAARDPQLRPLPGPALAPDGAFLPPTYTNPTLAKTAPQEDKKNG